MDEGIELAHLARDVRAADREAFVVPSRIVRRVIREDRRLTGFVLNVPHRKCYVTRREPLLDHVLPSELGLDSEQELPEQIILIGAPNPDKLKDMAPDLARLRAWRLLFHARVHVVLDALRRTGKLSPARVRERVDLIGQTQFDEIRSVLKNEDLLLPPRTDGSVWVEFAANFLDLRYFAPQLLRYYFPNISDLTAAEALVVRDVDARALFERTRVPGAKEPSVLDRLSDLPDQAPEQPPALPEATVDEERALRQARPAKKASQVGNAVRAAIRYRSASRLAPPELRHRLESSAGQELDKLAQRLRDAIAADKATIRRWRAALEELLELSVHGFVAPEARLLYDLQKVCIDHERGVNTVDLMEWLLSFGRRKIVRALPSQGQVLMTRHLRRAMGRLPAARISIETRTELSELLKAAVKGAQSRLRETFRPRLREAFEQVGLERHHLPEDVALEKIIEELLDRVVERGLLRMGDLRDALSRNALKLPDCSGWRSFWNQDPLLRLDRRVAASLDGVYQRGEFYLRWLQRMSAVTFGTRSGRWLTRFVFLPLGGAFLVLEGLQHTVGVLIKKLAHVEPMFREPFQIPLVLLSFFLLGLLHHRGFRRGTLNALRHSWRGVCNLVWHWPAAFVRLPTVARFLASRPILLTWRLLLKPLFYAALFGACLGLAWRSWEPSAIDGVTLFLIMNLLLSSPLGRQAEEVGVDWVSLTWHRFRVRIVLGLFRFIANLFKSFVEATDRVLYTVDEWLRFQSGATLFSKIQKAVLGTIWFFVSYLFRLYVNLLIEPQINPIKHFPVVTVSHKIILPASLILTELLATPLKPILGTVAANAFAGGTVLLLPGVFGFLVWEFKENWRLFRANRSPEVRSAIVGSHGETVLRLMKPGFHSGTLPKLYKKLRRSARASLRSGKWRATRRVLDKLHHVEESIHRFLERDFIAFVHHHGCLGEDRCHVGDIELASNSVRASIRLWGGPENDLQLSFEEQSGWLVAGMPRPGWVSDLDPTQLRVVTNALSGLFKTAGVEMVRYQVEVALGTPSPPYDIADEGLVVWPSRDYETEIIYPLGEAPVIIPRAVRGVLPKGTKPIERTRLLFKETPLPWNEWILAWDDGATTRAARLIGRFPGSTVPAS